MAWHGMAYQQAAGTAVMRVCSPLCTADWSVACSPCTECLRLCVQKLASGPHAGRAVVCLRAVSGEVQGGMNAKCSSPGPWKQSVNVL